MTDPIRKTDRKPGHDEVAAGIADQGEHTAEQVAERADDLLSGARAAGHDVAKQVEDTVEAIAEQAKEAAAKAKDAAGDGTAYVKGKYRENPVLVIAVGAAALVAVCLGLRVLFRR